MVAQGIFSIFAIISQKPMAISADKFKVRRLRNCSFKLQIIFRIHTYIPLLGSGGTARRWKMFSARSGARHVGTHFHHYNAREILA